MRRRCDVCGLIEAEHPEPLGNDCYRRAVAARFPMSAPARWEAPRSPLEVRRAQERGLVLQVTQADLWRALAHDGKPELPQRHRKLTCPYCRKVLLGRHAFRRHLRDCGMGKPG